LDDSDLPPENIFGHTEKVRCFQSALAALRAERGGCLSILDLGCGNGWAVTRHLGRPGDKVLGVDMHGPSIEYAQKNFARDGLEFRRADLQALHDTSQKWDAIVMGDVLEHLDDPAALLSSCVSLLAPGGRVLVSLPNGKGCFELESALSRAKVIGPALLRATGLFVGLLNRTIFHGVWTRAAAVAPADIPYNLGSPHVQFKSRSEWLHLFAEAGYRLESERNLAFLSGPFSNYLLGASRRFCLFNVRVASRLPPTLVSNWAFVLAPQNTVR
jgi:SAM-dependent methyltransferase